MNLGMDNEKERGFILRILDRAYPDKIDIDILKKQLIELKFMTDDVDMRGNIAYLQEKGLIKTVEIGDGAFKRTIAGLTANGKDLVDGLVKPVLGVSL